MPPPFKTFEVSGASTATAATADNAVAGIWNPSSTKRIMVQEIHIAKTTAGAADRPKLRRTSARGTASTTATPGAAHDMSGDQVAPVSGFLLDLAYSVQPTFKTGDLRQFVIAAAVGAGLMWVIQVNCEIAEGEGLAIVTGSALAFPVSTISVVVGE
jgi:hypothetical protein